MIEHVYRRASEARAVDHVLVATDDERIAAVVEGFGGIAMMTSAAHPSGTDRLAEIVAALPCSVIVNVQGDEPLIDPATIDAVVAPLLADPAVEMTTLCREIDAEELASPHVVKVVRDRAGYALYFSRAPIPFTRTDGDTGNESPRIARGHIGLYGYRRSTLLRLAELAPTALETAERLEQLRALEHGIRIKVLETTGRPMGVDTPDDLDRIRQRMTNTSRQ
jgi:3-deoxy-manno-octulosonate cytidylyltransferase (CMP-KDO synthetase)